MMLLHRTSIRLVSVRVGRNVGVGALRLTRLRDGEL